METELPKLTVYFDGSRPLCRAEIGYYGRKDQVGAFCFVDISEAGAVPPEGIAQQGAMKRFHVRASYGRVLSGVAVVFGAGGRIGGELVEAIRAAQKFKHVVTFSRSTSPAIADRAGMQQRRIAYLVDLAFLAPDIVQAIVDGRQPPTLTADRLIRSRHRTIWADQRTWISAI